MAIQYALPWLEIGEPFPDVNVAWPTASDAPGLLAAGAALDVSTLLSAYSQGIFPWYSRGQPTLWWNPDPRMVLQVKQFKLHRSLHKVIKAFQCNSGCEIRLDSAFQAVIENCAHTSRSGQSGTWILPEMVAAYQRLHEAGHAHSVETWIDGQLVGGLYCVNIGRAVFGESMFCHRTDASKLALAGLVCFCRAHDISWIDCQQNTKHLASLGAREVPRTDFLRQVQRAITDPTPPWKFETIYWRHLADN